MMQSNIKIAVTGGIGSGKSTVCRIIEEQGFKIVSCDKVYAEMLNEKSFVEEIATEFGEGVKLADGTLDRKKLSELVFNDKEKLKALNKLTHSRIMDTVFKKMEYENINFCEVPLLFENGYEKLFDKVIVVLRDKTERVNAIIQRDKTDEKSALKRMKNQIDYDNTDFRQFFVIRNNSDIEELRLNTVKILNTIFEN